MKYENTHKHILIIEILQKFSNPSYPRVGKIIFEVAKQSTMLLEMLWERHSIEWSRYSNIFKQCQMFCTIENIFLSDLKKTEAETKGQDTTILKRPKKQFENCIRNNYNNNNTHVKYSEQTQAISK